MITKKHLLTYAKEQGFPDASVICSTDLIKIFMECNGIYRFPVASIKRQCNSYFQRDLFSEGSSFTFLICGLSCYRKDDSLFSDKNDSCGILAPFAQRNYYAEAVARLKRVAIDLRKIAGLQKKEIRIFCNSGAPEKFLAWASRFGAYGNNSLIIHKTMGTNFIIAGLLLFFPLSQAPELVMPKPPGIMCHQCDACTNSCPTSAIKEPGIIDTSLCLQALSTTLTILPGYIKKAFGNRIYGCQVCQDVCPYNNNLSIETSTTRGNLGSCINLEELLHNDSEYLSNFFKKTVPGSSWIDIRTFQRNALLAAGNSKDPSLIPLITPFTRHHHPALVDAALWALDQFKHDTGN